MKSLPLDHLQDFRHTAGMSIPADPSVAGAQFHTTHWSVVLAAGTELSSQAGAALERLCRAYWYPLYAYVRRRGFRPQDAEDLTQSFFTRLLEKNYLADADRSRGRFRTFLLAALGHFLADEWDKSQSQKRGGGVTLLSFDAEMAEKNYHLEPVDHLDPQTLFERRWVSTLFTRVLDRLEQEHRDTGRSELFDTLKNFLTGERDDTSYATAARRLNLTENAVKQAAHRLRRRYREIFRDEIAQTLADPGELDDEVRHILAVIGS